MNRISKNISVANQYGIPIYMYLYMYLIVCSIFEFKDY